AEIDSLSLHDALPIFAADGEAERVDAGGVDGVDLAEPGDLAGYGVAGQLVDEPAEGGVLLGRPADHGEGPDGVLAVVDAADAQRSEEHTSELQSRENL